MISISCTKYGLVHSCTDGYRGLLAASPSGTSAPLTLTEVVKAAINEHHILWVQQTSLVDQIPPFTWQRSRARSERACGGLLDQQSPMAYKQALGVSNAELKPFSTSLALDFENSSRVFKV